MWEYRLQEQQKSWNRLIPGWKIYIITVARDFQVIVGDNIKIKSDLKSCDKIPAKLIDVQLPEPLDHLIAAVPDVNVLPYFQTPTEAGVTRLRKVWAELLRNQRLRLAKTLRGSPSLWQWTCLIWKQHFDLIWMNMFNKTVTITNHNCFCPQFQPSDFFHMGIP